MQVIEIIKAGDFEAWDEARLREIKMKEFSSNIGTYLYENEEIRLWEINLQPKERIPFRSHKCNYSCTSFSEGLLLSRNINGQVVLLRLKKGAHAFWECKTSEMIHDLENVGETPISIKIIEEK